MRVVILATFAVLALAVITIAMLVFYPFAPFDITGQETIPDVVCPLDDVGARANATVEEGWDLRELEIISRWEPIRKGVGAPVDGGTATIPEPGQELAATSQSPVIRIAPGAPGEYRLLSEAQVVGTFGEDNIFNGWPKVQVIEYQATNTLTVLPVDDKMCGGEA